MKIYQIGEGAFFVPPCLEETIIFSYQPVIMDQNVTVGEDDDVEDAHPIDLPLITPNN